jgi:BASS family bile acid:Na+ symporter
VATVAARAARLPPADRVAIALEASLRNINLGFLIKASLFPASGGNPIGDQVLFVLALAALPIALSLRGRA